MKAFEDIENIWLYTIENWSNATQKSEYVLVGTLLSFGIAAFAGIVINLINGI